MIDYEIAFSYCHFFILKTIIMVFTIVIFRIPYDVLTIKQVSINYMHVICEVGKEFLLDYLEVRTMVVLRTNGARAKNICGTLV